MKKQGEIISIDKSVATIRVYKKGEPSSLTLKARLNRPFLVMDFVNIYVNPFVFFFSVFSAYLFPFIVSALSYLIASLFTRNIAIIQAVFLLSLGVAYILAVKLERTNLIKNLTVGEVTDLVE